MLVVIDFWEKEDILFRQRAENLSKIWKLSLDSVYPFFFVSKNEWQEEHKYLPALDCTTSSIEYNLPRAILAYLNFVPKSFSNKSTTISLDLLKKKKLKKINEYT